MLLPDVINSMLCNSVTNLGFYLFIFYLCYNYNYNYKPILGNCEPTTTGEPTTTTPLPSNPDCPSDAHWMCPASDPPQCVRKSWVCDGFSAVNPHADCDNGADETPERCGSFSSVSYAEYSYEYGSYEDEEAWTALCPQSNAVACCTRQQCVFDSLWGSGVCSDGSDLVVSTPGGCLVTPAPRIPAISCEVDAAVPCRRGNRWT